MGGGERKHALPELGDLREKVIETAHDRVNLVPGALGVFLFDDAPNGLYPRTVEPRVHYLLRVVSDGFALLRHRIRDLLRRDVLARLEEQLWITEATAEHMTRDMGVGVIVRV